MWNWEINKISSQNRLNLVSFIMQCRDDGIRSRKCLTGKNIFIHYIYRIIYFAYCFYKDIWVWIQITVFIIYLFFCIHRRRTGKVMLCQDRQKIIQERVMFNVQRKWVPLFSSIKYKLTITKTLFDSIHCYLIDQNRSQFNVHK